MQTLESVPINLISREVPAEAAAEPPYCTSCALGPGIYTHAHTRTHTQYVVYNKSRPSHH
jgi:hypothetical protein